MNVIVLVGNVGKDPTLQKAGESKVARFSIAVSTRPNEPVLWVNCEAWDGKNFQLASLISDHLKKGMKVTVQGELCSSSWTDKDGNARKSTFVRVRNAQWVQRKAEPAAQARPEGDDRW